MVTCASGPGPVIVDSEYVNRWTLIDKKTHVKTTKLVKVSVLEYVMRFVKD